MIFFRVKQWSSKGIIDYQGRYCCCNFNYETVMIKAKWIETGGIEVDVLLLLKIVSENGGGTL